MFSQAGPTFGSLGVKGFAHPDSPEIPRAPYIWHGELYFAGLDASQDARAATHFGQT